MINFAPRFFAVGWLWTRSPRRRLAVVAAAAGVWTGAALAQTIPASGPAVTTAPATQPAQVVPEAALQAIEAERYAEAVALLEPLAKAESPSFDVLMKLGGCCDQLAKAVANDFTPAGRDSFNKYSGKAVDCYLRASTLALTSGDPRAEVVLRRVLFFAPRNPFALRALGRLYESNGSGILAITQYREYIKTPEGQADYDTQIAHGRLLVALGYWRPAVELLEKIRAVSGPDAEQQLALAYLAGRQPEKALEAANRAVSNPRRSPEAFIIRASLFLQLGERSDPRQALDDVLTAVRLAREMLAANPTDDNTWQKSGGWRQGAFNLTEQLKGQAKAADLDPAFRVRLAGLIRGMGELTRLLYDYDAVNLLKNGAGAEDAPVELLVSLAQGQRDIGQAALAVQTAERILQREPDNPVAQKIKDTGGKPETK